MADALFHRLTEDRFEATELARGPWDPHSCHAGAPAALLASWSDAAPAPATMRIVRLTYEILRPVPLAPIQLRTQVVRDGRRVQLLETIGTADDGAELLRCRALRQRTAEVDVPASAQADPSTPAAHPEDVDRATDTFARFGVGFWTAVDVRPYAGEALGAPGPGAAWFRLTVPVTAGLETTPVVRVAAAADYGNGIAPPLDIREHLFVNPDLTVHLHREPVDEWVALESRSVAQRDGTGLTTSTLLDRQGRIGTAMQSLFVSART